MRKTFLAALIGLFLQGAAFAVCTTEGTGLGLKLPNYGDRGDVWAKCVRDNFDLLNDVVLSTSSGANFVLSSAPVLTGGLTSSSWANFASSVAVAGGFYGSGAGLTSVPSSSLVGAIPTALVNLSTVTTALSDKVAKTGDTMSGQLTTKSSMTAQHVMLNQTANPSLTFHGNNENNGGLIQYLQSDGDLAWKLWHNPSLADDLYLYSYLDGLRAVQAWKQNGNVGVGTVSPTHKFHVVGGAVFTSSVTATDFHGDGSGLSGVIQSTATGYYPLYVATATYALNGGGGGVVDSTAVIDGLPIGSIIQYSTTTAPDGYLYCDGSYVSTTTYSELFAVTGHRYSTFTVSGSPAVFQLPDFRGMFARGAEEDGFRVVGSTQTDTFQGHWHNLSWQMTTNPVNTTGATAGFVVSGGQNVVNAAVTDTVNGTPRTSTETRPENIAVAFMIKYAHVGTVAISSSSLLIGGDNTFEGANTFEGSVTVSSFTATGNVSFNIPAGSSVTWSCPTGFTAVQSQGNMLGCIQNAEEGTTGHWTSINNCFTKYGGRLPFFQEIKIAFDNYALTDETDDIEWVGDIFYSNGTDHRGMQITTSGGITYDLWTNSFAYRCFIPK